MTGFVASLRRMTTFVLVPGAGLGGWAWARVTPHLRAAGHDVHPITLTGTGDRAHLARPDLGIAAGATDAVAVLETEELSDVVLVGHSFGGTVISAVAERAATRIARLVYLDAVLLQDGHSVFDDMGPGFTAVIEDLVAAHDGATLPWLTDEQLDAYYGDHGLTREDLAWMRRHATAHPVVAYRERVALRDPAAAALPRTYIRCTATPGPPRIAEGTPGWDVAALPTGHWPMVTLPEQTAALLHAVARRQAPEMCSSSSARSADGR